MATQPSAQSAAAANAATAAAASAADDDDDIPEPFSTSELEDKPEEDYVAVLHGYGRVEPRTHNYVLGHDKVAYEFIGGVCKQVPRKVAEHWKTLPGFRIIIVGWPKGKDGEPVEPGPAEFAKAAGIRPMDVNKLAAYIGAANLDKLIEAMGRSEAEQLLAAIESRVRSMPRKQR